MNNSVKNMTFTKAMIAMLVLIVSLFWSLKWGTGSAHVPLIVSAMFAGLIAIQSGYKWDELLKGILNSLNVSMEAILLIMLVGMLVGAWVLSGVVPTMIYYGLKIISPNLFLVTTFAICSIVSVASGSSWTTASTVGIALLGVSQGLGIPLPMTAGAIISGSYFGDKMSPLSDTTNLAAASAGANLFDHIKHMVYTSGTSWIIASVLFGLIGLKYTGGSIDPTSVNVILDGLSSQFIISPIMLIPPLIIIVVVVKKIPAIPGLLIGVIAGGILAWIVQGASLVTIVDVVQFGYVSDTGVEVIDSLLSRGGMNGMMYTISLIICALIFGGILESAGVLNVITNKIVKLIRGTGSLVSATVFTSITTNIVTGDQYLAIILPGRIYKSLFKERRLKPKNLSRTLEAAGTITSPLIPWNVCGAFMTVTLGVPTLLYLPFCFFNYITPLVVIVFAYAGITMEKNDDEVIEA